MENPAFQDIDQSLYESNSRGVPFNMSQRRPPHHLPSLHHPQQHAHAHAVAPRDGVTHPADISQQASLMIGPQTTQMHNGRIIGVIGTHNNAFNINPNTSQQPMYQNRGLVGSHHPQVVHNEPMYSCQGPQGHDHIYQCPGHRHGDNIDPIEHVKHSENNLDPRVHLDNREYHAVNRDQYLDHRNHQLDHLDVREHSHSSRDIHLDPRHQYLDNREQHIEHMDSIRKIIDPREQQLDFREQRLENRDVRLDLRDQRLEQGVEGRLDPPQDQRRLVGRLDPSLDQRPEYHYGGSDYSSTEPIYAHPDLYPTEIGTHIPTLSFNNMRASLRAAGTAGGIPSKYLVRSDSCGNSTSSSTLPTVSALLAQDASHMVPGASRSMQTLRASLSRPSKGGDSVTPTKLKRQGLFGAWKVKFLQDEGSRRKVCLLFTTLAFVLILVFGILGTVLYLT
ncbi:unnamed protein product, partial [Meganyctiphanes norvegica]